MKIVNSSKAPGAIGPYSQAIVSGGFLFASGCIPLNEKGEFVKEGDIKAQTEQVLKNMQAILDEENLSFSDVVKTTIFITDMSNFAQINEIYGKCFDSHKPARSCVAVKELPKNSLIEIEFIAKMKE